MDQLNDQFSFLLFIYFFFFLLLWHKSRITIGKAAHYTREVQGSGAENGQFFTGRKVH